MKAIAIIPARMNSKRFPGKNMALLGGKPLVQWVIEAAINSKIFHRIYLNTQDEFIWQFVDKNDDWIEEIHLDQRDDSLCPYKTTTDDIIQWYLDNIEVDCYCFLQPTNPFTEAHHIQECFKMFQECDKNVISVNKFLYEPNGCIYMSKPGILPYDGDPVLYLMSPESSLHIDYKYQLSIAEGVLNGKVPRLWELDSGFTFT